MCEHRKRRSQRGKFDLGGVWMMVSIQGSISGSNFGQFSQIYVCFACVVINHQKRGEIVVNMAPFSISSSFILVIHDNMINETNHIV
jgi:hypothetical protein